MTRVPGNPTAAVPLTLRAEGVTWRALDDHIVVLDLESSLYLSVTGAGAVVWKLLDEGTTLDAMVDAVLEVFEVEPEKARRPRGIRRRPAGSQAVALGGAQTRGGRGFSSQRIEEAGRLEPVEAGVGAIQREQVAVGAPSITFPASST